MILMHLFYEIFPFSFYCLTFWEKSFYIMNLYQLFIRIDLDYEHELFSDLKASGIFLSIHVHYLHFMGQILNSQEVENHIFYFEMDLNFFQSLLKHFMFTRINQCHYFSLSTVERNFINFTHLFQMIDTLCFSSPLYSLPFMRQQMMKYFFSSLEAYNYVYCSLELHFKMKPLIQLSPYYLHELLIEMKYF